MLLTSEFQQKSQEPIARWQDILAQDALRIKPYARSEIGPLQKLQEKSRKVSIKAMSLLRGGCVNAAIAPGHLVRLRHLFR